MLLTNPQVERLETTLVELSGLDESLARRCGPLIKAVRFDEAVTAAFVVLEERLRRALNVSGGTGVRLSRDAFTPKKGKLVRNLGLEEAEEQGVCDLFVGAFLAYRNRAAHTFAGFTLEDSTAVIQLVNLLLLILRQTEIKWYDILGREVAKSTNPDAGRRFRDFLLRLHNKLGIQHYEGKTWEPFKASVLYQARGWDEPRHYETAIFYFDRTGHDAPELGFPVGGDLRRVVDFDRERMEQRLLEAGCERVAGRKMITLRLLLSERNDQTTFDRLYDVIREYVERYG